MAVSGVDGMIITDIEIKNLHCESVPSLSNCLTQSLVIIYSWTQFMRCKFCTFTKQNGAGQRVFQVNHVVMSRPERRQQKSLLIIEYLW